MNPAEENLRRAGSPEILPPEPQSGNVEYKLKIVNPSELRFQHLVTQLKWRMKEGNGKALYKIGVLDDGKVVGTTTADWKSTLECLNKMAKTLDASLRILREKPVNVHRILGEVCVYKSAKSELIPETRIALLGGTQSGKTTLLAALSHGILDNGRGRARLNVFKHLHEIKTGHTSSITREILGFDEKGNPVNYCQNKIGFCEKEIKSTKIIHFIDLPGHEKYVKTAINGVLGYKPHYLMFVISTQILPNYFYRLSNELCLNRCFFVITKADLKSPETIICNLNKSQLKSKLWVVRKINDVILAAEEFIKGLCVPLFVVSNVSGCGLQLLFKFLFLIKHEVTVEVKRESGVFQIVEMEKKESSLLILHGYLCGGVLSEGSAVKIGPFKDGSFKLAVVKSVFCNRTACSRVTADYIASVCLDRIPGGVGGGVKLRRGMVLLQSPDKVGRCRNGPCFGSFYFQASVTLSPTSSALCVGTETTAYINGWRQTVLIAAVFLGRCVQSSQTSSVVFKLKHGPAYLECGQKMVVRDNLVDALGRVTQVFPLPTLTAQL